jgi:hypothetical protein
LYRIRTRTRILILDVELGLGRVCEMVLLLRLFRILPTGFARIIFPYLTRAGCDEGEIHWIQSSDRLLLVFENGNYA